MWEINVPWSWAGIGVRAKVTVKGLVRVSLFHWPFRLTLTLKYGGEDMTARKRVDRYLILPILG